MEEKKAKEEAEKKGFKGKYEFLSNSYPCEINFEDISYPNVEVAFWALRVKDPKSRRKIARLNSSKAKAKALSCEPIEDWDNKQYSIMKRLLFIKFSNKDLEKKLKATKGFKLINEVTYRDEYWGIRGETGRNLLGKCLMEVRENL